MEKQLDYKTTSIGLQNLEVCIRMLVHDLLDMNIPEVKNLLDFYSIRYTDTGGFTMSLPRLGVLVKNNLKPQLKLGRETTTSTKRRTKSQNLAKWR